MHLIWYIYFILYDCFRFYVIHGKQFFWKTRFLQMPEKKMNGNILLESRATKMTETFINLRFLSDLVIHPAAFQQKTQRTSFRWPFSESLHTCVGNPNHLSQSLDLHLERSVRLELSAWALIVWSLLLGPRLGAETHPAGFWIFPEPCSLSGWTLADLCLFPLRARVFNWPRQPLKLFIEYWSNYGVTWYFVSTSSGTKQNGVRWGRENNHCPYIWVWHKRNGMPAHGKRLLGPWLGTRSNGKSW